jgi:hypothetical protein
VGSLGSQQRELACQGPLALHSHTLSLSLSHTHTPTHSRHPSGWSGSRHDLTLCVCGCGWKAHSQAARLTMSLPLTHTHSPRWRHVQVVDRSRVCPSIVSWLESTVSQDHDCGGQSASRWVHQDSLRTGSKSSHHHSSLEPISAHSHRTQRVFFLLQNQPLPTHLVHPGPTSGVQSQYFHVVELGGGAPSTRAMCARCQPRPLSSCTDPLG